MTSKTHAPTHEAQDTGKVTEIAMVAYLQIAGMGCPRCAERVRNGLQQLDGVSLAEIDLNERLATVVYDPQQATPPDLVNAVAAAGNDGHHHYEGEFLAQVPAEIARAGWA